MPALVPDLQSASLEDVRCWFESALGKQILREQRAILDQLLPELFGYHLLQLSVQQRALCNASPINHKITMGLAPGDESPFRGDATALPFENDAMDVVLLHHLLDFYDAPQAILREAARVTIPMGRVLIVGFNPFSLWGLTRPVARFRSRVPWSAGFIRPGRLMDWLDLLDFRIDRVQYCTYGPPISRSPFIGRVPDYSRGLSRRTNLPFGACYVIEARKYVGTMTRLRPQWSRSRALGNLTVVRPTGRSAARSRHD